MLDRERERPQAVTGPAAHSSLTRLKRLYRWLNLTLVHQAVWPLVVLLLGAPALAPADTPLRWFAVRLAAPGVAAGLALLFLVQTPVAAPLVEPHDRRAEFRPGMARRQAGVACLGLPLMVGAARLLAGPVEPAAKLLLFGAADVLAFQLIHFGVVARSFPPDEGQTAAVGLFGASWALRGALLAALDANPGNGIALGALAGLALGLAIGALSRALRAWPGGFWPAAAIHWLLIYAVLGFVG